MEESKVCQSCGGINDIRNMKCKYCGNSLFKVKKSAFILSNEKYKLSIVSDLFIERKDFDHKYVSNKHAYLFVENGTLKVRDLKSTNGTMINDKSIEPLVDYELHDGDKVTFADLSFKVEVVLWNIK